MNKSRSGFTIVELLIVIVVIAILAAISIVAYNGIQERAKLSKVQSTLKEIYTKSSLVQAGTGNLPDRATIKSIIAEVKPDVSNSDFVYCYSSSQSQYAVVRFVSKISPKADGTIQYVSSKDSGLASALYSMTSATTAGSLCDAALPGWTVVAWYGSM